MLESRGEGDGGHLAARVPVLLGDRSAQRLADDLGERRGVLGPGGVLSQGFEDGGQLPNRNAALEQVPQHALQQADRDFAFGADDLADEGGLVLAQPVDQELHVLAGEQFVRMLLERLGQVGDEHRLRVDDSVPAQLGGLLLRGGDPQGRQSVHRLAGLDPVDLLSHGAGVHGEEHLRLQEALGDGNLAEPDLIGIRLEIQVVPQPDQWNHQAELLGELPAQGTDAVEDRVAPARIDHADQAHTDVDGNAVHVEQVLHGLLVRFLLRRGRLLRPGFLGFACHPPDQRDAAGQSEKLDHRHSRHERHGGDNHGGGHQGLAGLEELSGKVLSDAVARRDFGDQKARADGDDDRGDLADQAVADGENRIGSERIGDAHAAGIAHGDAADEVDGGDEQAGHGVAPDELAGAVHRPVELALLDDLGAPLVRLGLRDGAGVQVGVDGHLLAGHGVEGEAGGDFADALGALGDDDELDDDEDQEDHEPDHEAAAGDEAAERLNDSARVALQQDQPGRGDIQGQPEQRDEQQQRGERR